MNMDMEKITENNVSFATPWWWSNEQSAAWDMAKAASQSDWEQSQMPAEADRDLSWTSNEPAMRYGFAARTHYDARTWDDALEARLGTEWNDLQTGRDFEQSKFAIRRGWESAKNDVH